MLLLDSRWISPTPDLENVTFRLGSGTIVSAGGYVPSHVRISFDILRPLRSPRSLKISIDLLRPL